MYKTERTSELEQGKGDRNRYPHGAPVFESLKPQKAEIETDRKEIAKLEAKKEAAEAKAAEAAKKVEAEAVLKKLLTSGMTADEILEKLK